MPYKSKVMGDERGKITEFNTQFGGQAPGWLGGSPDKPGPASRRSGKNEVMVPAGGTGGSNGGLNGTTKPKRGLPRS